MIRKSVLSASALFVASVLPGLALASCVIPSFTATYNTKIEGMSVGDVTQTLHVHADKTYTFDSLAKSSLAFFSDTVAETSSGKLGDNGLIPQQYHLANSRLKHYVSIHYDWSKSLAHAVEQKKDGKVTKTSIKIKPGVQDFLSYQLQFQRKFRQNPNAKSISLHLIHKGKVRDYTYTRVKAEKIRVPLGDIPSVLFERHTKDGTTQIWFASSKFPGTMVQLHQTANGKVSLTMQLKGFKVDQPTYCMT